MGGGELGLGVRGQKAAAWAVLTAPRWDTRAQGLQQPRLVPNSLNQELCEGPAVGVSLLQARVGEPSSYLIGLQNHPLLSFQKGKASLPFGSRGRVSTSSLRRSVDFGLFCENGVTFA